MTDHPKLTEREAQEGWVEWNGGDVPVEGTHVRGFIQLEGETIEQAEKRPLTILDYWPWFGEYAKPVVRAYRVVSK